MLPSIAYEARNNQTFRLTEDLSAFLEVLDLSTCVLRAQVHEGGSGGPVVLEFVTANGSIASDGVAGVIDLDLETGRAVFRASPVAALAELVGPTVFDLRVELETGASQVIFEGSIDWIVGKTRAADQSTSTAGIGDTVFRIGSVAGPMPIPASLTAVLAASQVARDSAQASAELATEKADLTAADALATAADRAAVHVDRQAADADAAATASDRIQTGLDRQQTGSDASAAHADRLAADADALATAGDRVQTGLDRTQTGLDAQAAHADRLAADADALATAADRSAVHTDRLAADADAVATAADRVQTGLDRVAAAGSAATATVQAGTATAKAGEAAASRDAAAGSLSSVQVLQSSTSTLALQTQGYMNSAAASAASAAAVSGLSNLSAAARAIALASDVAAVFVYDTTKDTDGGAWRDKVASTSWMQETLNTATRGATAKFPAKALIVARNAGAGSAAVTIYDATDSTCPIWMVFNGTTSAAMLPTASSSNISSLFAVNGVLWVPMISTGLYAIDFILDGNTYRDGTYLRTNANNIAARHSAPVNTAVIAGLANTAVNDVAATVLPHTQPNPLRCGLPNPTVAVGTNSGVSVIRADGVVCNSSDKTQVSSVGFTSDFALRALFSTEHMIYYRSGKYLASSFTDTADDSIDWYASTPRYLDRGGTQSAISAGKFDAIRYGGLTLLLRDKTNLANSAVAYITDKFNTGFMPGAIKAALAESSADLSSLVTATIASDDFSSYADTAALAAVWLPNGTPGGTDTTYALSGSGASGALAITRGSGGNTGAPYLAISGMIVGRTYTVFADVSGANCKVGGCDGAGVTNASFGLSLSTMVIGAKAKLSFVATATSGKIVFTVGAINATATVDNISIALCVADRSFAGNHAVVNGTLTRSPVAPGAELAAYSGFSASNYLEIPYSSGLDFGTGDFCAMAWVNLAAAGVGTIFAYGDSSTANGAWRLKANSGGALQGWIGANTILGTALPVGAWALATMVRRSGNVEIYLNAARVALSTYGTSVSLANATLRIGNMGNIPGGVYDPFNGSLALQRVTAYAPTPDQIAAIYAAELPMFQPNAKCLASGANIQSLAYDPDTDQLAVANSTGGVDVFKGLVRVANYNSTTASGNLFKGSALPATFTYGNASLGNAVSAFASWGGIGYQLLDNATNGQHYWVGPIWVAAGSQAYGLTVPIKGGTQGWAIVWLTGSIYAYINTATGAVGVTGGSPTVTVSALASGEWLVTIVGTPAAGNCNCEVNSASANNSASYAGAGAAALIFGKPMLTLGSSVPTAYVDGLSQSTNAKAVAFAGGDIVVATAGGVDAFLASAPGLRETAKGRKVANPYNPTFGIFSFVTTDATPTVGVATPLPEGKAFRVRDTVAFVQYGGVATEKAMYVVEALATRDLGGNVVVVSTTTTISESTASLDYVIQANTTAQTIEGKGTGKSSTRGIWTVEREVYDVGLMNAA